MAATANVLIEGKIIGTATGDRKIGPINLSSAAANGSVQQITLLSGANTITVPQVPAPTMVIITLPPTNTQLVTFKGVAGDTGTKIGKTGSHVISFDTANLPASFVLSSAADQTALYTEIIFI